MPIVNTKNIMVGAGHLYVSAADTTAALPAAPADLVGPPVVKQSYKVALDAATAWRYVGATSGGVEIGMTQDVGEVEVDQLKDAALIFNTGQSAMVSTELAEPTLANLLLTWGMSSKTLVNAGDTLNLAQLEDDLVERSVAVVGNAPRGAATTKRERVYYGRRVINVEAGGHTLSRTENTTLPLTFRLLPDPATVGAEYGTILDRSIG